MVAIFVLFVFLFFISVDLIVLKIQGKHHPAFELSFPQFDLSIFDRNSFTIPSNVFFSKGHTWLKKNSDGLISIGIDEFGTIALGTLSILDCAEVGTELKRGEMIFQGAYGNKNVKFLSPINGMVKSVNSNIIGKKISNPYETWGVQIVSKDFSENQKRFLSGIEASNWIKKEYLKLIRFINCHSPKIDLAGATMFDGGSLSNDMISSLVDRSAIDFEKEFLSL
jgi:glycine cleavage system H lipoate-binding protein